MLQIFRNLYVSTTKSALQHQIRSISILPKEIKREDPYIVNIKYDSSLEHIAKFPNLVAILREKYAVTEKDIKVILQDYSSKKTINSFSKTLDILVHHGFKKSTIVEQPWIIDIDPNHLKKKVNVLLTLKMQDINHFAPFLKLSLSRLQILVKHLQEEAKVLDYDNRLYYISEKLNVPPKILGQLLSKRLFMLEMPLEFINANLENMITYGVASINMLKDLWVFRYKPNSVRSRFERAKIAQKDKLMPWMARCPERVLQRSLKITIDEKELLGDHKNIVEYIADRLGFSVEITEAILKKHPATLRVKATKVSFLLLNFECFGIDRLVVWF